MILTTDDLRCRLDKLKTMLERRHEMFKQYEVLQREHYFREMDKVKCVLDYVKTDEWCIWLNSIKHKVHIEETLIGALMGRKGKEVSTPNNREDIMAAIKDKLTKIVGVSNYVPVLIQELYRDYYRAPTHIQITSGFEVEAHIEYLDRVTYTKLPIDELEYLVSLNKDVEVDVNWLRNIDGIKG